MNSKSGDRFSSLMRASPVGKPAVAWRGPNDNRQTLDPRITTGAHDNRLAVISLEPEARLGPFPCALALKMCVCVCNDPVLRSGYMRFCFCKISALIADFSLLVHQDACTLWDSGFADEIIFGLESFPI